MVAERLVELMRTYGVLDFILPFILVFTIVFAVLDKTKLLGSGKKNFNVVIALILGLLFVVPHIVGVYPLGYDPVLVLNQTLPSIALVVVAVVMLLILLGIFGAQIAGTAKPWIGLVALLFVGYIFGASLGLWRGPYDFFSWWTEDVTELLIIILVFGLIVWFIVKEPGDKVSIKDFGKGIEDTLSHFVKKE